MAIRLGATATESSTAGLIFIFGPVYAIVLGLIVAGLTASGYTLAHCRADTITMTDPSEKVAVLADDVRTLVEAMKPWVLNASKIAWSPEEGLLPVIRVAILRKQLDSLEAVMALSEQDRAYAGVATLRSACEELLWVKYLGQLPDDTAEELVRCLAAIEISDSLEAQNAFSPTAIRELHLLEHLTRTRGARPATIDRLRLLGRSLGWPRKAISSDSPRPSAWHLAERTGQQEMYRFLFHATSRFVHFSTLELMRRGWGKVGALDVDSGHFSNYWSAFALYWGVRFFLDCALAVGQSLPENPIGDDVERAALEAARSLAQCGAIPIITAEELYWPE